MTQGSGLARQPTVEEAAEPVDLGGDAVDRALRLGTDVLGRPLAFTESGTAADAGPMMAGFASEDSAPVLGLDGMRIGTLTAVDLSHRSPLTWAERRALADVAALIAGDVATRDRVGQIDNVSGLPNRRRFERDFAPAARRAGPDPCVLLVTLADARHYNELLRALGHARAETFVLRGAEMIQRAVGRDHALHHVSVLSFAMVLGEPCSIAVAREVVRAFGAPVMVDGLPITTRIGVGLTRVGEAGLMPAEALRSALVAAQDSRRVAAGFAQYDRRSDEAHLRAFSLLRDLNVALGEEGQLALAYQPRVDLATGRTAGAEALIRWTHPTLGPISPGEFVPLAETTAIIDGLTDWVLERACRQSAVFSGLGVDVKLSVNVSPLNLQDKRFGERFSGALARNGVPPEKIELEFTEGVMASSEPILRETISAIRRTGVTVAIDDFGSGYANLSYLTSIPADVIKIDGSFMRGLETDGRRQKLLRAVIDMSHDLGFEVVGEGVETQAVYGMLADWRCDEGQGYFMSRPLTPTAFAAFASAR